MTRITIDSLLLRPLEETDAPRIAVLCNDEILVRNTSRLPYPYTIDKARCFIERAQREAAAGAEYRFAVCSDGTLIACVGVMPQESGDAELGYWVGAEARGQGVATKAAGAAIAYAFDSLDAARIGAGYFIDNPASARVMEKLGFKATGETVMTHSLARGEEVETIRLSLRPADFVRPGNIHIALP